MSNPSFNKYRAQTRLAEVGQEGQKYLAQSRVVVIGCGGLGSIAAPYLVGAGVGNIFLMDGDVVDESNLHRQVFYAGRVGQPKAEVLANYCQSLNAEVHLEKVEEYFTLEHEAFVRNGDVVLDCSDDIQTKLLLESICKKNGATLVAASIEKFEGFLAVISPDFEGEALAQIYDESARMKPCTETGILGPMVGILGLQQAAVCLKLLLKMDVPKDKFTWYDFKQNTQHTFGFRKTKSATAPIRVAKVEEVSINVLKAQDILVSILEEYEQEEVLKNAIHMPLSQLDIMALDPDASYVFYCDSGKRSWALVDRIQRIRPEIKAKSLHGGLSSLPKNE